MAMGPLTSWLSWTMIFRSRTSLGAAIAAGVGAGLLTYEQAAHLIRYRTTHKSDPDLAQVYAEHYAVYRDIYKQMKPLFDRLV